MIQPVNSDRTLSLSLSLSLSQRAAVSQFLCLSLLMVSLREGSVDLCFISVLSTVTHYSHRSTAESFFQLPRCHLKKNLKCREDGLTPMYQIHPGPNPSGLGEETDAESPIHTASLQASWQRRLKLLRDTFVLWVIELETNEYTKSHVTCKILRVINILSGIVTLIGPF